jgi:hypothetical protein
MPKISKSALLRALAAAETGRPSQPGLAPVAPLDSPRLAGARRASAAALRPVLVKAGFNDRLFVELRKQHGAELKRLADREQSLATRRSAKIRKTLRANIANKLKALGTLANLPASPFLTIIDRPFLIWARPRSNIIWDSNIATGDSWAKVKAVAETGDKIWGSDTLSFYFLWDNPTPYYAVIDAATFITFNGFARAYADGSFWGGIDPSYAHYSYLSMWTDLTLWQWSDNPPTPSSTPIQYIASLTANAGFFEDTQTAAVSGSSDHSYTHYVVKPSGVIVFEVTLTMSYSIYGGHTLSDFSDDSFEVSCPYMVVGLLSAPPASGVMATS